MYQLQRASTCPPIVPHVFLVGLLCIHCAFGLNRFSESSTGSPGALSGKWPPVPPLKDDASDRDTWILPDPMYMDRSLEHVSGTALAPTQNTASMPGNMRFLAEYTHPLVQSGHDATRQTLPSTALAPDQNMQSSPDNTRFLAEYTHPLAQSVRDATRQPLLSPAGSISSSGALAPTQNTLSSPVNFGFLAEYTNSLAQSRRDATRRQPLPSAAGSISSSGAHDPTQNTPSSPGNFGFLAEYTNPVARSGHEANRQPLLSAAGSISSNGAPAPSQNTPSSPGNFGFLAEYTNPVPQSDRDMMRQPLPSATGSISSSGELENYERIPSFDSTYISQRPGAHSTEASLADQNSAVLGTAAGNNFQQEATTYTGPGEESFSQEGVLQAQQEVSGVSMSSGSSSSNINQLLAKIKSKQKQAMQRMLDVRKGIRAPQGEIRDQVRPSMPWNAQHDYQRQAAIQLGLHDLHSAVVGLRWEVDQLDNLLGPGQLGEPFTVQHGRSTNWIPRKTLELPQPHPHQRGTV